MDLKLFHTFLKDSSEGVSSWSLCPFDTTLTGFEIFISLSCDKMLRLNLYILFLDLDLQLAISLKTIVSFSGKCV
jgi:hypothetical protein